MKQNILETMVGIGVIVVAIIFVVFAYSIDKGNTANKAAYLLKARFQNIDGIVSGSNIMIAGVKIGTVDNIELDKDNFNAIASLLINSDIKLPKDSQAAVSTGGLLGDKYIAITPGADDDFLVNNDQIKYTQSAVNFESLIGKMIYSIGNK